MPREGSWTPSRPTAVPLASIKAVKLQVASLINSGRGGQVSAIHRKKRPVRSAARKGDDGAAETFPVGGT